MSIRSGQSIATLFTTRRADNGMATNADTLPTGKLYINAVSNAAVVTVANVSAGKYAATFIVPTLAIGDLVELVITATVNSIVDSYTVWSDTKDVLLDSNGKVTFNNTSIGAGVGSVLVDHNYGGTDALSYQTSGNQGIDNATIWVYLKSDYDAGRKTTQYIIARSTTDVNGHWTSPVMLDPAIYTVVFSKQEAYGPDTVTVTVT